MPITTQIRPIAPRATFHQPELASIATSSFTPANSATIPNRIEIDETDVQSKRNTMTENRSHGSP